MQKDNIVLIGFMGVGKGSLARTLAHKSSYYALDTDDLIESYTNKKVKHIFKESGEKAFRQLEQKTADWLAESVNHAVISTGGGFFMVENLQKIGTIVYLSAEFDWIVERILKAPNAEKKLKKRPLFQNIKKAHALYEKRKSYYHKVAHTIVDVTQKEQEALVEEILTFHHSRRS